MAFDVYTLSNGLRIIAEQLPSYRSVSTGLWVGTGSQYENENEGGISHFLEHMVFKGTSKRTAKQIAEEMDAVGGNMNAFTAKECTCFYAKTTAERLELSVDMVSDLATHPVFDSEEMEKEKGVILEEIDMSEDTPDDVVHEQLMLAHFGNQAIALPILGREKDILDYKREDLSAYWKSTYRPQNCVLSVAGRYNWEQLKEIAEQYLGSWSADGGRVLNINTRPCSPNVIVKEKDIEQVHIELGFPSLPIDDPLTYELSLFNGFYGGNSSSRLFQKIREESGMAYTVCSYPNPFTDCGMLSVYAATNPETALSVYEQILSETEKFIKTGLTKEEFEIGKEQLRASFILATESTSNRMQSNGRRMLLSSKTRSEDEVLEKINALSLDTVNDLIRSILKAPHSLSLVGRGTKELAKKMRG